MPNRDGTGPMGNGRLGRGLGPCGKTQGGRGRGLGFRRACRFGFGNSQEMYPYNQDELKARKQELEAQLNWVNSELNKDQ